MKAYHICNCNSFLDRKISKLSLVFIISSLFLLTELGAQTLISHDFNDDNFNPYEVNKADQESRVYIKNGSVETHWQEDLYNGTNSGRKAQFRPINDIIFTQHIWMGLKLKIHSDYMKENTNTNAGLMQIWGYNGSSGSANHMCMLKFDGRNGGALVWQHRYNSVVNKTHYLIEPNFPRNEFVDVVVHVQLKTKNTGIVQVWVNGELKLNKTNQTIGWGDMDETGMINGTYCFGTSLGQYNFFVDAAYDDAYDGDNHLFDGHMPSETRTVTYDNVTLYNGVDGYSLVDPSDSSEVFTPDPNKTYYIDAPHHNLRLAANGESENTYTTSTTTIGADVEWRFVQNANGYWHIQRAAGGSIPRLRTDNTEFADMQGTAWSGTYTYYEITTGYIDNTFFLTLPDGPTDHQRLQVNSEGNARFVPTSHALTWESFKITEVPNSSSSSNLATNGTATQSTTDYDGIASRAIDGNTNGTYSNESVSHTTTNDNNAWWQVDLGANQFIGSVVVWNRTDSCCSSRLSNFKILVLNSNGQVTYERIMNDYTPNPSYTTFPNGAVGRYIRIELTEPGALSLAEVEVFGSGSSNKNIIEGFETNAVAIYPNPVESITAISGATNSVLEIYDVRGILVLTKNITSGVDEIDLTNVVSGIYYAKVKSFQNIEVIKLIKK